MKKWINGFCLLPLLLVLTLPVTANAADYICTTNNGKITIVDYTGSGGVITIPDTINGLPVTSIEEYAFENSSSLTGVTIPSGVTNIGFGAFTACNNLTAITVNATNSFYSSMDGVLLNKSQATLIQCPGGKAGAYAIPSSVTLIDYFAFFDCAKLTGITIPVSVTIIKEWAFGNCTKLTSITIPSSVTIIDDALFDGCTGLTSVTIPDSVISIGVGAFGDCTGLTSIAIPASVTSIGNQAFRSCAGLTGVYFSGNAPSLGLSVFVGADNVTVYYLLGAAGWPVVPEIWGGRPTALWPLSATVISNARNGRIGNDGSTNVNIYAGNVSGVLNSGVVMFRLPAVPPGRKVVSADLRMSLYQTGAYPFGVDLYALRTDPSPNIIAADYYSGPYGAGAGRAPIMDNFVHAEGTVGFYSLTNGASKTNLADWVQSQYDAGAVAGQFVFLCLAPDATATSNQYYRFRGSSTTNEEPLLTITTKGIDCLLTVNGGTGGGSYTYQQQVIITASNAPPGYVFRWSGDTKYVASITSSTTTVTMLAPVITLTATYVATYTLTITNGNGSGSYTNQQQVAITADTPAAGKVFDRWIGATQYVASVTSSATTVTMPAQAIALTATYKDLYYTLTVNGGIGDGSYTNQQQVTITADAPVAGKMFDRWIGDTQYVASVTSSTTVVTMPLQTVTLIATYKSSLQVDNMTVSQRPGTKLVDITYDISSTKTNVINVSLTASNRTAVVSAVSLTGDVGTITLGAGKSIVWNMGADWDGNVTAEMTFTLTASDGPSGGDPMAVTWEVVNDRWVKNTYTNGDVTMSDRDTGRMWTYNANPRGRLSWDSIATYCNNLVYAGYSDWILPDKNELHGQYSQKGYFSSVQNSGYWSSSAYIPGWMWYIDMYRGGANYDDKSTYHYAWPMRIAQSSAAAASEVAVIVALDSRDYTLSIASERGVTVPVAGTYSNYCWQSVVTCSVESVTSDGWMFMGWSGDAVSDYTQTNVVVVMDALSKTTTALFSEDADGDGLLNTNETQLGTNPRNSDSDDDGMTDPNELVAGTSPTNQQSVLRASVSYSPPSEKLLCWDAVSGRVYSVYWTTNLMTGFQCLESNIPWTQVSFTNSTDVPCGYYKIDVRLAD